MPTQGLLLGKDQRNSFHETIQPDTGGVLEVEVGGAAGTGNWSSMEVRA